MKIKSQLKSGIILSYVNLIIGNIIPLFYTPVMLRILGQSEYGLYSLATSVTSYLSLMSLGIGSAVVRYLVKFRAKGDADGEGKMLGLFSCIFYVISFLTLIVGCIITLNIDAIYGNSLSAPELSKIKVLTILLTVNSAVTFACSVYSSVVIAHEKFIFQQILNILTTIFPPVLNIVLLLVGFDSLGLVISALIISVVSNTIKIIYCSKKINIKPIYHDMPFYLMKELLSFSFFIFLSSIVNTLHAATDKVIIGSYLGTIAVAIYNVGLTFRNIVQSLSSTISSLLVPKVTAMVDKEATPDELTQLMIKVGRLQFLLVGLAVGGFCAFGREFMVLYAGPEYNESYYIAVLLMIPMAVPLIQNIGVSIINAMNKHKFRALVTLFTAILNVFATIWLIQHWGIIGAAVTTCCCNFIGSIFLMNWYYHKKIHLNIPLFWKNILKLAIIPISLSLITIFIGNHVDFTNPFFFILGVLMYIILYALLMWPNLNEYEKNTLLSFIKYKKRGSNNEEKKDRIT